MESRNLHFHQVPSTQDDSETSGPQTTLAETPIHHSILQIGKLRSGGGAQIGPKSHSDLLVEPGLTQDWCLVDLG